MMFIRLGYSSPTVGVILVVAMSLRLPLAGSSAYPRLEKGGIDIPIGGFLLVGSPTTFIRSVCREYMRGLFAMMPLRSSYPAFGVVRRMGASKHSLVITG